MNKPVRTTLTVGLLGGLLAGPIAWLATCWGWPDGLKLMFGGLIGVYALLLAHWSGRRLSAILFPLALLAAAALWPQSRTGFLLLSLGILGWVRSSICFQAPFLRLAAAEIVTLALGSGPLIFGQPHSPLAWALAVWFLFLVQAIYFFMLPQSAGQFDSPAQDPFETSLREIEKILGSFGSDL